MSEYALRLANGEDTAPRVRAGDALGLTPNGVLRARGGLRPDGGGVVTVSAGTMNVSVSPFSCWVDASPAGQVGYPFVLDAAKTLPIDPGDATLDRIDVVAVVVREGAYDGGGTTAATLEVVKGTPGAGVPALPTSASLAVREVNVPAGTSAGGGGLSSSNLGTDRRVFTTALGGVLPCASTARPASPYAGQEIYETDTGRRFTFNGTLWAPSNPAALPYFKGTVAGGTPVGTGGALTFTSAEDNYGQWGGTSYAAPLGGLYRLRLAFKWDAGAVSSPAVAFYTNSTVAFYSPALDATPAYGGFQLAADVRAAAGDTISVQLAQGSFTTQSDPAENNAFIIEYLRP